MKFMCVDDSAQRGRRQGMGTLVAAGCIIINGTRLRPLAAAVDEVCRAADVPDGTELKWSPPPENWLHDHLHGDDRSDLFRSCLDALASHGGRAVAVVWDTGRTTLAGGAAFRRALEWALERFVMHLSGDELGVVIADRPGGGATEDDRLLGEALALIEDGTPYVNLQERVALNLLTTPSHLSRHVQLADLVAGSTAGMVGRNPYAPPVFERVKPLFVQNAMGARAGVGLKLFPDDLTNLYFHLLGESEYRGDSSEAVALPSPRFPYETL